MRQGGDDAEPTWQDVIGEICLWVGSMGLLGLTLMHCLGARP